MENVTKLIDLANLFLFPLLQILQESPDLPESVLDFEQFDEVEAVGKSLLDRLTVPVIYPDGYVIILCRLLSSFAFQ